MDMGKNGGWEITSFFLLSLGYSCLNLAQFGPFVISSHLSTYWAKFMKHCESNTECSSPIIMKEALGIIYK